ncbi:hypothetical protein WJ35_14690 [Burkholderia ubonensis]|uniref:Uncharacterized protein n=1 Tax=Burkholderia ubonensis TaxID=101571 RepID=A0A1B4LGB5_9BURK|nr:hypothetical protein WJ35_14690 [Burkholderia ubonensis]
MTSTKRASTAPTSPVHHTSRASTTGASSTPVRRRLRSDCGTSATPMPADTRLTIVCIWIASWPMRGVARAAP